MMDKTEEKVSASLLLAEWKRAGMMKDDMETASIMGGLSRRIDDLAEKAGICLHNGHFHYSVIQANYDKGNSQVCFRITKGGLPAAEQQAIQEWLLIKQNLK